MNMNISTRSYDDGSPAEQWNADTGWYSAYDQDGNRVEHRLLTPEEDAVLNPTYTPPVVTVEGPPGQPHYTGDGPPGVIVGAQPGDEYIDDTTGDIYKLE